jgi:hypothetical protein
MFKSKKENTVDSAGYMSPGIHDNIHIVEVKGHEIEAKSGAKYNVLDIVFQNAVKEQHNHRMFNPADGDEAKREDNEERIASQLAYIAGKMQGKEMEVDVEDWDGLCAWAVENIPTNKIALRIKLLGNVYNDNARVQISSYPGWLKTMASKEPVKFSRKEAESNQEYWAKMNPSASSGGDAGLGAPGATPF